MINTGLKGKLVLVTGGNHGIGAATARAFSREGAKVFINYLRLSPKEYGGISEEEARKAKTPGIAYYHAMQTKSADEVVRDIREKGGECEAWETDLADPANIPKLYDRVEASFGKVDVLINNAAHDQPDTFVPQSELPKDARAFSGFRTSTVTAESHDRHFAVNSRAVVLMMEEYARRHIDRRAQWGRIINITTVSHGFAGEVSYGASKHAMESYSRAAAFELGPYGITINIICPGAVQTGWITPKLEKELSSRYPLRRIGRPQDIANAVIFFASDQAEWITGQMVYVGGGHMM